MPLDVLLSPGNVQVTSVLAVDSKERWKPLRPCVDGKCRDVIMPRFVFLSKAWRVVRMVSVGERRGKGAGDRLCQMMCGGVE